MAYQSNERGAVLLYILIAVALLAGLSAIMARGSRVTQSSLNSQQSKILAQEIIDYSNTLAAAVQKLRLRGCGENQLDFGNTIWTRQSGSPQHDIGHNPNAIPGCSVFGGDGNILPVLITIDAFDPDFPYVASSTAAGHGRIMPYIIPGFGSDAKEDVIYNLARVKREVCIAINDLLMVPNIDGEPPVINTISLRSYGGAFTETASIAYVPPNPALSGKLGCMYVDTTTPYYTFMGMLMVR